MHCQAPRQSIAPMSHIRRGPLNCGHVRCEESYIMITGGLQSHVPQ